MAIEVSVQVATAADVNLKETCSPLAVASVHSLLCRMQLLVPQQLLLQQVVHQLGVKLCMLLLLHDQHDWKPAALLTLALRGQLGGSACSRCSGWPEQVPADVQQQTR